MEIMIAKVFTVATIVALLLAALAFPAAMANSPATAPAAPPTSNGTTIDQGVAIVLIVVALALTYLIH